MSKKNFEVGDVVFDKVHKLSGNIVGIHEKSEGKNDFFYVVLLDNGEERHLLDKDLESD